MLFLQVFALHLLPVDLGSLPRMRGGDSSSTTPVVRFINLHPAPCLPQEHATSTDSRWWRELGKDGRVIKCEGGGSRNEDADGPQGGVLLKQRTWLINVLNLWSIHDILLPGVVGGHCNEEMNSGLILYLSNSCRCKTCISRHVSIIKCKIQCWQACVQNLSTQRIRQMEKNGRFQAVLYVSVITPVSRRSSTLRWRKPDTSSLGSAKLAFGSVMSELLDSSSAGIPPSPDLSAPISLQRCQMRPLTLQSIAGALFLSLLGSLSPACTPSHQFLPLPVSLVPISLSFPCRVFEASQKSKLMTHTRRPVTCSHSFEFFVSQSALFYFLFFSIQGLSSCLFHLIPQTVSLHTACCHLHFEVTECDATNPAAKLCFITFLIPLLTLLCKILETDRRGALQKWI